MIRLSSPTLLILAVVGSAFADPTISIRGRTIDDWTYQLQGSRGKALSLTELGNSAYDLAVIDYSSDGSGEGEFTAQQIAALKASPGGPKVVLAYLSIGEAEDYRWYWDHSWTDSRGRLTEDAPAWLAPVNRNWEGNYKVRYWDPEWQRLIFGEEEGSEKSYLDRILDAGFDGIYLDLIDAFEYFGPDGNQSERPTAAADMAAFVEALATYARAVRSDFIVIPQNGTELANVLSESELESYFAAIDALAAEDSFFYGHRNMNNAFRPQNYTLRSIQKFQEAGLPILSVDYVSEKAKVNKFYRTAMDYGFVPYAAPRALDAVKIYSGWEPD